MMEDLLLGGSEDKSNTATLSPFLGLRVCMVGPYLPRKGGVTIQTHLMVDGLRKEGAEVVCVDTIMHSLSSRYLLPLRIFLQPIVTAIRFLRSAPRCDIVHIQACSWWGFLPVLACAPLNKWLVKKRLVISFHGGRGHLWIRRFARVVVPLLRMADSVAVVSVPLKKAFSKFGVNSEILPNIVNLDRFHYRQREHIEPNIVWIRQLSNAYDPLTAIQAFAEIQNEIPDATITFIGDGELKPQIEEFIAQNKLKGVHFTGRLANEEVPSEFDKASMFLNSSSDDGFPTCLLEASASGLPIVTTNPGGIPDMIENGVNGIIVPVRDSQALAKEVISLLRDPERASKMGKSARENAEKYSWSRCARDLALLYNLNETNAQLGGSK
jgi:glycosyltransferase involved in cell wall biosynthesis